MVINKSNGKKLFLIAVMLITLNNVTSLGAMNQNSGFAGMFGKALADVMFNKSLSSLTAVVGACVRYVIQAPEKVVYQTLDSIASCAVDMFHYSASIGNLIVLKGLIQQGIHQVDEKDARLEKTVLHIAAENGHLEVVRYLIKAGASIDEKNLFGHTALYLALTNNHLQVARYLILCGADVNGTYGNTKSTLLHSAVGSGSSEKVKFLIEAVGDSIEINKRDASGRNALWIAVARNQLDIVQLLIDAGTDVNQRFGVNEITVLSFAIKLKYDAIVKLLRENGATE